MEILVRSHSGLRWIALIMLLIAIINAAGRMKTNRYEKKDRLLNLFTMISLHTQILLGLILYFISPKVNFVEGWMKSAPHRFFALEHILMMVLAVVLITIGRRKAENDADPIRKHRKILIWYVIGLLLIFAAIPWPFRANLGVTTWF